MGEDPRFEGLARAEGIASEFVYGFQCFGWVGVIGGCGRVWLVFVGSVLKVGVGVFWVPLVT